MNIPKEHTTKLTAALILALSAVVVVVGASYLGDYFGGSIDVPKWAFYLFMVIAVVLLGYSYAIVVEAFGKRK